MRWLSSSYLRDVRRALSAEHALDHADHRVWSECAARELCLSGLDHVLEVVLLDAHALGVRVVLEVAVLRVRDHHCLHVEATVAQVHHRVAGLQVEQRRSAPESLGTRDYLASAPRSLLRHDD